MTVHLEPGWRLLSTGDLSQWIAKHDCPKCIAAVSVEIGNRERHDQRTAARW